MAELHRPIVPYVRDASFPVRAAWYTAPRRLLDYLLMYVQEGEMIADVEGRRHRLHAGDFCLIQPGELHTLEGPAPTITPYVHLDVFYNPARERSFVVRSGRVDVSGLEELMQPRLHEATGIRVPTRFVPLHPAEFRDTMLKTIGIWQRRDLLGQLESHYLATGLVLSVLQSYARRSTESLGQPEFLNWITSFMSLHLSEPLSVSDMAEHAGLSASRFSQVFRDRFGRPPHQFLLHLRIQRAQDLLQHTGLTMREISVQCGFSDVHHFAKTFRRLSGQTPGSYRSANQQSA
ncbi:MAG TPA: helix-turn-helix domain-containing protein [Rubrobacter sp.]|nr:helix-turn-helix domain-containing protein [Rubrobacter sp.]